MILTDVEKNNGGDNNNKLFIGREVEAANAAHQLEFVVVIYG